MPFAHCRFILRVSSLIRALQGRTPACGNRSFPLPEGGCGGHPYSLILRVSSLIRALQGRAPACGNRSFPLPEGGGASLFAYFARIIPDTRPSGSLRSRKIAPGDFFRYALLWCAAHSVTHLMCAPSFAPSTPRLPKNILRSPTFARTRATDSSHTSHRLPGGVSRRRCPSHTVACLFVAMLCCATALGRSHT